MKTKKVLKYFSIFAHEKEQDYLRQMHKTGWKFVKVSGFCVYHFEECVPEDVIYQLDYNQDGISHKEEYVKMFNDCGWEYLQDYVGYSYFRKPASQTNSEEEIFCDEASRLQMLERVYKGRVIPLLIIFLTIILPQFIHYLFDRHWIMACCLAVLLLLYLTIFGNFAYRYFRFKNEK